MQSLRFQVIDDYGAYFQFGVGTHGNSLCQIVGPYRINSVQMSSSRSSPTSASRAPTAASARR
jgi:hypothetical protein